MRLIPASALTAATLAALLLGGCTSSDTDGGLQAEESSGAPGGSAGSPSDPDAPDAPAGPDCDAVWRTGETLPDDYTACAAGSTAGPQDVTECVDGSRLVVFDDVLWAVTGEEVVEPDASPLQDTEAYGEAFAACTGE